MRSGIKNLSGIILAGGNGTRLQNLVTKLYGYARPKQYCTFVGARSMLSHTVDRAKQLIPEENLIIVTHRDHHDYIHEEFGSQSAIKILEQPCARETGAGILLPLLKIESRDPDSIVAVFPSDHFILNENKFMESVMEAAISIHDNPNSIILLGIKPKEVESGYGWIEKGLYHLNSKSKLHRVKNFIEKPDMDLAVNLLQEGCLLNTFVMIGKCSTFIEHINMCLPELRRAFKPIRQNIGTLYEDIVINRFFKFLPEYNFSKFVLERISNNLLVMEIDDVYWSDWGEEERLLHDLEMIQKVPFALEA